MNAVDQILSEAFRESPIQGALLGTLLDGGRIVCVSDRIENLFNLVPDVFFFERRTWDERAAFSDFGVKDILFLDFHNVDDLWSLASGTGAQVAVLSDQALDPSLADYVFNEGQLRSALLNLGQKWKTLKEFKGQIHLEGSKLVKGLFLDRDGVLIRDEHYLQDPNKVEILDGVVDALKEARAQDYRLIVITNQSGIGRGLLNWSQYEKAHHRMLELFAGHGIYFDRVLRAPYFDKSAFASGLVRPSLRKPRPGMIHSVVNELRIDLSKSILVGDSATDLMLASMVQIPQAYLMKSPKVDEERSKWRAWPLLSRTQWGLGLKEVQNLKEIFSK